VKSRFLDVWELFAVTPAYSITNLAEDCHENQPPFAHIFGLASQYEQGGMEL